MTNLRRGYNVHCTCIPSHHTAVRD